MAERKVEDRMREYEYKNEDSTIFENKRHQTGDTEVIELDANGILGAVTKTITQS
jgi:hypothetical protein